MIRYIAPLAASLGLVFTAWAGTDQDAALERVRSVLKDPASATFQNVREGAQGDRAVVCGEVNAKNSYGGYEGYQRFVVKGEAVMIWNDAAKREALGGELFETAFLRIEAACP